MCVVWEVAPGSGGSYVGPIVCGSLYAEIDGLHLL